MNSEKLIRVKFVNRGQTSPDPIQWLRQFPHRKPVWGKCHFIFDPNERDYDWFVTEHDLPAQSGEKTIHGYRDARLFTGQYAFYNSRTLFG